MPKRIAYLVNEYPKVSHSFIRREILALENQGFEVMRLSLRGWNSVLVDPTDIRERERTRFILQRGLLPILFAALGRLIATPASFFRAFGLAIRIGMKSRRSLPFHIAYLAEACLIERWLREWGATHLHAHFGDNPAEIAMLVRALGGPEYSFTVHGQAEIFHGGIEAKVRHAAFVVAISSFGRSQLFHALPSSLWNRVRLVHCGLDAAFLNAEHKACTEMLKRIVCVGRLCPEKGQLLLLDAFKCLVDRGEHETELVLVGDGDMRDEIEQRIDQLELRSRVRITGWLSSDEVRDTILDARGLVLPSFSEGLPVVIMESMALGRPVISTYVGGIPELVSPGSNGWLVPPGSVEELSDALADLVTQSASDIEQMGRAGREAVNSDHAIDCEAAKLARHFLQTHRDHELATSMIAIPATEHSAGEVRH